MAITWGTIKSLLLFFGPMLLPKAISYYRSFRSRPSHQIPIQSIPPSVSRALLILSITTLTYLVLTAPYFGPENIFTLTQSRIQIPIDVLFTRLSALRQGVFTPTDLLLRQKVSSLESRLLYFQYGPKVLANCPFCNPEESNTYFYYALPSLLAPHLFNTCILALVTSGLFAGKEGAIWRNTASIGAATVALLDIYMVNSYNHQANSRATKYEELSFFYWNQRIYRLLFLIILNSLVGWGLYLSSTNRFFVTPPTTATRLESAIKALEGVRMKMSTVGILRNTVNRDEELRGKSETYWITEGRVMGELMEEREVVEGVKNALDGRIDLETITRDAESYARNVIGGVPGAEVVR